MANTGIKTAPPEVEAPRESVGRRLVGVRTRLMLLDLAAAVAGITLITAVRPAGADGPLAVVVMLMAYAVWFGRARLYSSRFITRRLDEIRRIVDAGFLAAATVGLAAYVFEWELDQFWLAGATAGTILLLSTERELVRRFFAARRASGRNDRRVLVIGDNTESDHFVEMFEAEPELGYAVVGRVQPGAADDPTELTTVVLSAARINEAHGVIIAATAIDMASSNRLIRDLVEAGIHVELSSTLADISSDRLTVRPLGRFPVVYVEPRTRGGWRAVAKRSFDLLLAGLALILLFPVLLTVGLLVKLTSSGPVLFRQERVGRNGVEFRVLKFRTMVVNAEELLRDLGEANEGSGPLFKMKADPRVTRVGGFLRKTSLDELPQLWNVIRNEMSLVGPRPALREEMVEWEEELYARLRVKPGITGMWQVSGRSTTTFAEYTRLDLYYVDNWSLVVDLAILAKTIPAVLKSDGAY